MTEEINVHALLLRAEAKAKTRLENIRKATASSNFQERLATYEEEYATAVAVRENWEILDRASRSSGLIPPNPKAPHDFKHVPCPSCGGCTACFGISCPLNKGACAGLCGKRSS